MAGMGWDCGFRPAFAVDNTRCCGITAGIARFSTTDELWHRMATNNVVHVLATAFSAADKGGSGRNEPVAFVTQWDRGRCFNLVLGHDADAMNADGFCTLLVRGAEWAATGQVTEPVVRKKYTGEPSGRKP